MSAYGHQMEREYSAQSLISRGGSEVGSRYVVESGFYMSSYAATIFISALVIIGISFITMLIALTVMLQNCQNRNAGVIESWKIRDDDYGYCRMVALHAELNSLGADFFPEKCQDAAIQYIKGGQFMIDLNTTVWMAENYLNSIKPAAEGLDVVLMDVDDLLTSNSHCLNSLPPQFSRNGCNDCIAKAKHLKHIFLLKLYMKIQASGWSLILISRNPENLRNATIGQLISVGCVGWSSLIMRSENEMQMNSQEYFSRRRTLLQEQGYRIMAVISSRMEALRGPRLGKRLFKLPNPIYYRIDNCV